MKKSLEYDFESVLQGVGGCHRFQLLVYVIYTLNYLTLGANLVFMSVGSLPPTGYHCLNKKLNRTLHVTSSAYGPKECREMRKTCPHGILNYTPAKLGVISPTVEFGLVCKDQEGVNEIIFMQMFGLLCGTLLFGILADIYGRKKVWVICCLLQMFIGGYLSLKYSSTWQHYACWRLLLGGVMGGALVCGWTLLIEMVNSSTRFGLKPGGYYAIAHVEFAILASYFLNWRTLNTITNFQSVPGLLLLMYFIPESPRWLMQQGEYDKAREALLTIANINRKSFPKSEFEKVAIELDRKRVGNDEKLSSGHPIEIAKVLLSILQYKYTVPLVCSWFTVSCVSYGLLYHVSHLFGSPFILISALSLLSWAFNMINFGLDRCFACVGRKFLHTVCLLVPCLCFITVACNMIITSPKANGGNLSFAMTIFLLIGTAIAECAWTTCYTFASELYPTKVRNTASGLCSSAARLGAAISPYIMNMGGNYWTPFPYIVLALMTAFCAIFCVAVLDETKGKPLAEEE